MSTSRRAVASMTPTNTTRPHITEEDSEQQTIPASSVSGISLAAAVPSEIGAPTWSTWFLSHSDRS